MVLARETIKFKACDGTVLRGYLVVSAIIGSRISRIDSSKPGTISSSMIIGTGVIVMDYRADYYDAFNFAISFPSVDNTRIVYWGTSFSGGNILYAAAIDKRIKATIVQCPAVSGETRSLAFKDRIPGILKERARITAGSEPERVPLITENLEAAQSGSTTAMFPGVHAYEQENSVTVQTQLNILAFKGQGIVHRISPTPLLMVVPGNDILVTTASQMATYEKARDPKQLLYIDGAGHFDIYTRDYFEQNIQG
ncbi:hypothetical protein N7490_002137 [Penicillium lividum]|nr:hypothetical protein N7490_002137 [Penicillium lividum]